MSEETLRQKQSRLVRMLGQLVSFAESQGYAFTLGEAKRSDEQAEINAIGTEGRRKLVADLRAKGWETLASKIENNTGSGIRNSLHELGLAVDLNLFDAQTGEFLQRTEDHRPLGLYWESIGGAWGGRFGDGNHYSLAHGGRK